MIEFNPNPYKDGDPLGPNGRLTAIVSALSDMKYVLSDLRNSEFVANDTAVFIGDEGAMQLDASGVIRDIEGVKVFQNAVCDEGQLFEEFEQALQHGEAVISIAIEDDEIKRKPLVALLKSHHARKINYWGTWTHQGLG